MKAGLLAFFGSIAVASSSAQIIIDNTSTPEELVQNVLLGTGVVISNVSFNGLPGNTVNQQIGFFDGENCNLGIDYGVLVATGSVLNASGPNDSGSSSVGGGSFGSNDPDLMAITAASSINDAAVLEFDFVAISDTVMFQFIFASEEYPEFVNSSYNDVFGFFLSGPGIAGPYQNNAVNIAMVPGTTTPISINTLNADSNGTWYVDNGDGWTSPYNIDPLYIQYDGLTVPVTIIAQVTSGETHHMKIAIGDAGDASWDSAVFLSGASFMSPLDPSTGLPPGALDAPVAIATTPNPVADRVQISYRSHGNTSLRVLDTTGRVVASMAGQATGVHNEVLDVSTWPAGSYHVQLLDGDGRMSTSRLSVVH